MKLSVSLPDEDVEFLDAYARTHGYTSRSAVLQRAVRLLSGTELATSYADAWAEWEKDGHAEDWETAIQDGLGSADAAG